MTPTADLVEQVREALCEHSPVSDMDGPRCGMCGWKLPEHKGKCSYASAFVALTALAACIEELERERDNLRIEADTFIQTARWHAEKRRTAEARVRELEAALRQALDCKGSYEGVVSEMGGSPAICTKCEAIAHDALRGDET